jgi:hypothetical protein
LLLPDYGYGESKARLREKARLVSRSLEKKEQLPKEMYVFERYFFPCLYRVLDEGEIAKEQEQ